VIVNSGLHPRCARSIDPPADPRLEAGAWLPDILRTAGRTCPHDPPGGADGPPATLRSATLGPARRYDRAVEYRRLGSDGPSISAVGLGTNNLGSRLGDAAATAVLNQALDLGVTFIDSADIYGWTSPAGAGASESQLGRLLGDRRKDVVLATKFGNQMGDSPHDQGASRGWIVRAVEASLRRLRTDWIDLYQIHRPDPATPIEETLGALDELVRAGKVRYVGHSNFGADQIAAADRVARAGSLVRPVSAQMHYSLLRRDVEADVLPTCASLGLGLIPYFPLESGFLTGKYRAGGIGAGRLTELPRAAEIMTPANFERLERLEAFAVERGRSLLELAFGWLLGHPLVGSVIASASTQEQVRANVAAAEWRLSTSEMQAVDAL
jgi:aryl-alcohol dehydrogenase-like predicted oxidoreductase